MNIKQHEKGLITKIAPYFWRFKNEAHVNDSATKWVWEMLQQDDIKEALSLLELKRHRKLVKLANDQCLPIVDKNPILWQKHTPINAYDLAQHDMQVAGFKKVESL